MVRLWERELEKHFDEEEQFLFPECAALQNGNELLRRALNDHSAMRTIIDACRTSGIDDETAKSFGHLLEAHIRFEERELFPLIEEALSEQIMMKIGERITADRKNDTQSCEI